MTSFHHHHAPPIVPLAISVISCNEDAKTLRSTERNPRVNGTGNVRKGSPTLSASPTPIDWKDCLFVPSLSSSTTQKDEMSSILMNALPPDSHCPIEPFDDLCNKFTQIIPVTEKVARHYYDSTAPATIALVQAKQQISSPTSAAAAASMQQSGTNLNRISTPPGAASETISPGESCWCIVVMMPPRHTSQGVQRNRPNHSVTKSDIVNINLCVFLYHQEAIELMDSVVACCVTATREIDSALGSSSTSSSQSSTSSKSPLGSVSAEILHHLVNITKSIPRDLASFLPQLPESWSGAQRPPHAMIPLAHFIQSFDYPILMPLFSLLCQGASVVFTHSSPAVASQCCIALRGLLYPFAWPHHFVPITTSSECWPFPLMKNLESHSNAFLAGITASDLPALLIDHSKTQQPCELWVADCRTGTLSRAAPTIYSSRFSLNHPRIINLSFPSNILLKDSWEKAKVNMQRLTGSPKEHLRMFPDVRQEILNSVCGYWAESFIGQYRLALQPPRDTFEWDRFFYKFLTTTSLSAGIDSDPNGTIRALTAALKNTDMIGRVFVQSIFSLEKLTHLRMNEKETSFVPFWKWGLGSISAGRRTIRNKEQHDYYFFFRKCCEKFPNMYQDDQLTVQKTKSKSGFFDKIGDALNRAKDSVRNSISDLSSDRHFSLMVPYVSVPQSGQLPLMLKKPSDEQACTPRVFTNISNLQQNQQGTMNMNNPQQHGSSVAGVNGWELSTANAIQYQNNNNNINNNNNNNPYLTSTLMNSSTHENARVEAQCRFFPTYLRKLHWSEYTPHAKDYFLKHDRMRREALLGNNTNKQPEPPLCTPLPIDLLCNFNAYHNLLAPASAVYQNGNNRNSPPPNELMKISLPNGEQKKIEVVQESQTSATSQSPAAAQPSSALFAKISLPGGGSSSTSTSPANNNTHHNEAIDNKMATILAKDNNTTTPTFSTPTTAVPTQVKQVGKQSDQMSSLFGPSQEELEEQQRRNQQSSKPKTLDDFF